MPRRSVARWHLERPPGDRVDTGHETRRVDGLVDVVVRPGLEELRFQRVAAGRRSESGPEARSVDRAPDLVEHLPAVEAGHREVQHDQLEVLVGPSA